MVFISIRAVYGDLHAAGCLVPEADMYHMSGMCLTQLCITGQPPVMTLVGRGMGLNQKQYIIKGMTRGTGLHLVFNK